MCILTSRQLLILRAMLIVAAMRLGFEWKGVFTIQVIDDIVNDFSFRPGHYSRFYEANICGASK
jgi:hypothetical protein